MNEQLLDRPSIVRTARMEGDTLHFTVVLYDLIAPPREAEPVLELSLVGCHVGVDGEVTLPLLEGMRVWEIEQEEIDSGFRLNFVQEAGETLTYTCQEVIQRRRQFGQAEWINLIDSYEKWVRREQAEKQRLQRAINSVQVALIQREERARRILEQSQDQSHRALRASAKLDILHELDNVLKTALSDHKQHGH